MRSLLRVPAVLLVLSLASAGTAAAQCPGTDNLDTGACCGPATPMLPTLSGGQLPSTGVCYRSCSSSLQSPLRILWDPPMQPVCGEYVTNVTVIEATSGMPLLVGPMVLDYTRTWIELDPSGNSWEVWRFVAKADLSDPSLGAPPVCGIPSCLAPHGLHPTAFFYGYVDYAVSCNGIFPPTNALVLYHGCDFFIHNPLVSSRPGSFHIADAYALVGPATPAQPFIAGPAPAPSGPLVAEATRNVLNPLFVGCSTEDRLASGSVLELGAGCLCFFSTMPKQHRIRQLSGSSLCVDATAVPGSFASIAVGFPTLPWYHVVSTSLGAWSNPAVYPGNERVWVDEGVIVRDDPCFGDFVSVYYGATTRNGFTPNYPWPAGVSSFTDLAANYSAPAAGPFPTPVIGHVMPTRDLIYVNTP